MPWRQTPSRKKKAIVFTTVTTNAYQDQINAGFSKVCEIFKVRSIESLKYIREFHTPVCYCGDISTHRNVTLNKTNCDWLFDMSVKRPHGWALANESCHLFQTFSHQSEGLATRDYALSDIICRMKWKWHPKFSENSWFPSEIQWYKNPRTGFRFWNVQCSTKRSPHPPTIRISVGGI